MLGKLSGGFGGVLNSLDQYTGHARMGFTLGPITGRLASECILDGEPSLDISPLVGLPTISRPKESQSSLTTKTAYLTAKLVVVDGRHVVVGSHN